MLAEVQRLQAQASSFHVNLEAGMPRAGELGSTTTEVRKILRAYLVKHSEILVERGASEHDAANWPGPADAWGDLGGQLDGLSSKGTFTTYHWPAVTAELAIPKKRGPKSAAAARGEGGWSDHAAHEAAHREAFGAIPDQAAEAWSPEGPMIDRRRHDREPNLGRRSTDVSLGQSQLERAIPEQELANQVMHPAIEAFADEFVWQEQTPDMPKLGLFKAGPFVAGDGVTDDADAIEAGARPCDPYTRGYVEGCRETRESFQAAQEALAARLQPSYERTAQRIDAGGITFKGPAGRFLASRAPDDSWVVTLELDTNDASLVDELARLAFRSLMLGVLPSAV